MATSFAASVRNNVRKILTGVNLKIYVIATELFTSVVNLTPSPSHPGPYAKGHLANQWYPDENGFSQELSSELSDTGAGSLSRIRQMYGTVFLRKDGQVSLTNNLSYAYRAEWAGWPASEGWSGKSTPYHMVSLSLQSVASKYK